MRAITRDSIKAFQTGTRFKRGNTKVTRIDGDHWGARPALIQLLLHGNVIAIYNEDGELWISSCGYQTATTKERLNGLPDVHIVQRDFEWFLNGELWDGEPIQIDTPIIRKINPYGSHVVTKRWDE